MPAEEEDLGDLNDPKVVSKALGIAPSLHTLINKCEAVGSL